MINAYRSATRQVYIVLGTHHLLDNHNHRPFKSAQYTAKVAGLFLAAGFTVKVRLSQTPDDDFVFMARAAHYVPCGGGFSLMVQTVNAMVQGSCDELSRVRERCCMEESSASWLWSSKLAAIESKRRGVCSLCCRPQPGGSALGKKQCHHPWTCPTS